MRRQIRAQYVSKEDTAAVTTLVSGTAGKRIAVLSIWENVNNQSGNWLCKVRGDSQASSDPDILFLRAFFDIGLMFTLYDCPFILPVGDDLVFDRTGETSGGMFVAVEYALI